MNSRILCYHRVLPDDAHDGIDRPYFVRGSAVSVSAFEAQVRTLATQFDVIDEATALDRLENPSDGAAPWAWITFDDGYSDALVHAAPVLARLGLPATMFVSTATLDARCAGLPADLWYTVLNTARRRQGTIEGFGVPPWTFDLDDVGAFERFVTGPEKHAYLNARPRERARFLARLAALLAAPVPVRVAKGTYLDVSDLARLTELHWSIGAHGHTHALFTSIDARALKRELTRPAELLRAAGIPVQTLAYPNGAWNAAVAQAARDAGYCAALTIEERRPTSDLFALPRVLALDSASQ